MYYVIAFDHRPNTHTKFFNASGSTATTLASHIPSSVSHLGSVSIIGPAGLLAITINKWQDQATYDAFQAAHSVAITAYTHARNLYNTPHSITHTETTFSSSEVLF